MVAIEWSRRSDAGAGVARTRHLLARRDDVQAARDPMWPAIYGGLSGEPTPDLEAPSRDD